MAPICASAFAGASTPSATMSTAIASAAQSVRLGPARLQQEQHAGLHGELEVLRVAEQPLQHMARFVQPRRYRRSSLRSRSLSPSFCRPATTSSPWPSNWKSK